MGTAAIIALIISALAAAGSGIASYVNTKRTNETNQQMYEDWKSYNTPANQMDRLSAAGLNPYQVNGVSNTLSQPFQVGANSGIAEALSGLSNASMQAGTFAENSAIKRDSNAIRKDATAIQRDKLELEKSFTDLKKKMMHSAIKRNDNQSALFWSSVQQKDIVSNYLKRTMPFRVGSAMYDYLRGQQLYSLNEQMNPLKLQYYAPYMRSIINKNLAQSHYLSFQEQFARDNFLFNQEMRRREFIQNKTFRQLGLTQSQEMFNRRLSLSEQYQDLAYYKWLSGLGMDFLGMGIGKPMISKRTHKVAGGFPEEDFYDYSNY